MEENVGSSPTESIKTTDVEKMNRRKFRAENIRQNEVLIGIRKIEAENNKDFQDVREKEYQLQKERFMFERFSVEARTENLKDELKGIYKHCIAEVNKETEDLEERIKKADAKILELQEELKS